MEEPVPYLMWVSTLRTAAQHKSERCTTLKFIVLRFRHGRNHARQHPILQAETIRWLFIPFLQTELDAWADVVNNSRKRADRNKILPHGIPDDIYFNPERFGALDFKVYYFSFFFVLF